MRIGIDIRNIGKQRTGDEVVFLNLVKNLARVDSENEYCLLTDIIDTTVLQYTGEKLGISDKDNFRIVSLKSANKFIWNLWTLPKYLKKHPVDVYHTQYIIPFFVPKNIKIITHIHDVSFNVFPKHIKMMDLFFLNLLVPRSLEKADKIIAVSEFTKSEIIKYYGISPDKIEVVRNSLDEDFSKSDYSGNDLFEIRKKYNLPEKFILYIGTLQPRKNLAILIEAFKKVKDLSKDLSRPGLDNLKLAMAGNRKAHNFDRRIDKKIKELDIASEVIFPGFIDEKDKAALFQMAEVFVFPSLYEGFGIPILEAMSQKVPVLVSDIPAHREVAENAAEYFNPSNIDDFSEKLYNILVDKNLREKLINSGSKRLEFFSWQKSAEKMLGVYKKLK